MTASSKRASSTSPPAPAPSILEEIFQHRRGQVAAAERQRPVRRLQRELRENPPERRDFAAALRQARPPAIIAELKRASPSCGRIRESFPVPELARAYAAAGAAALSVLTEEEHFDGRLDFLRQARAATSLPILRKDFIFSPYQIWESAWAGADAILLIAAMLDPPTLAQLTATAHRAGLATLCEVHTRAELDLALRAGADCIGVNNRDLRSFQVDLGVGERLGPLLPEDVLGISESGLHTPADLERMAAAGFSAFLMGEHFMRAADPGSALAQLRAGCRIPLIKICGITNRADAFQACTAGADALGFVFAPSPRRASPALVRSLAADLPAEVMRVGVFAGASTTEILTLVNSCGLHAVQLHGPYLPADARSLAPHVPVWRAVAMPSGAAAALAFTPVVERFVLDHPAADGISGGSGAAFDWDAACHFAADLKASLSPAAPLPGVTIAGGLTPANVVSALRRSGADGADTASGVECAPGRKDHAAVSAFCRAAQGVLRSDTA
ncbi:MAG: indole-3-glycerol phosphate synthase TrpC [Terriglobales bacterium]